MNRSRKSHFLAIGLAACASTASATAAATIHARNFGNDIGRAISFSSPGDTVDFDGITAVLPQYTLKSHRTYVGSGAKLSAAAGKYVFQTDRADSGSFVLSSVDFTGPAIRCEAAGGWTHDVEIKACSFHGDTYTYPEHNVIFFSNGARNCNIHTNVCDAKADGFVIGYGYDGLSITDNDIHDGIEGIHYLGHFGHSALLTVSRNRFRNMRRMAIEIQGDGHHVVCEDNVVDGANVTANFNENMDTFGISLACDGAFKVDCHRNKIVSYERADGTGMRIAIELAADPKTDGAIDCADNYIDGTNNAISISTSLSASVHDNYIHGSLSKGPQISFGKNAQVFNNGPDAGSTPTLTWDPNRAWPIGSTEILKGTTPVDAPAAAPAATQSGAIQPNATPPSATPPSATPPSATPPSATQPSATQPSVLGDPATPPIDDPIVSMSATHKSGRVDTLP